MNTLLYTQLSDVSQQMNGYTVLLGFKYSNLCIKSDVAALMPVVIDDDGMSYDIEEVADVAIANEYQMIVYPKYPELLHKIIAGIAEAHPEFKLTIKQGKLSRVDHKNKDYDEPEEDNENSQQNMQVSAEEFNKIPDASADAAPESVFLLYTMPDVDKDRRDLLTTTVKSLHAECMLRLDAVCARNSEVLVTMINSANIEDANTVKDDLERMYKEFKNRADSLRDEKLSEIDEAYARYNLKKNKPKEYDGVSSFRPGYEE